MSHFATEWLRVFAPVCFCQTILLNNFKHIRTKLAQRFKQWWRLYWLAGWCKTIAHEEEE
jgi:hypothetical protein